MGNRTRQGSLAEIALCLLPALLIGACSADSWWGADFKDEPCTVLGPGTVAEVLEVDRVDVEDLALDTGRSCSYQAPGDGREVRVHVFHADDPDLRAALAGEGAFTSWQPLDGVGEVSGYQGSGMGGRADVFVRAISGDAGVNVDVSMDEGTEAEGLDIAGSVANAALASLDASRPR